jgi:hypothetical protein
MCRRDKAAALGNPDENLDCSDCWAHVRSDQPKIIEIFALLACEIQLLSTRIGQDRWVAAGIGER